MSPFPEADEAQESARRHTYPGFGSESGGPERSTHPQITATSNQYETPFRTSSPHSLSQSRNSSPVGSLSRATIPSTSPPRRFSPPGPPPRFSPFANAGPRPDSPRSSIGDASDAGWASDSSNKPFLSHKRTASRLSRLSHGHTNSEDGEGRDDEDGDEDEVRVRNRGIPQAVPQSDRTRVELFRGNLVLEVPVPQQLIERYRFHDTREFTHMRYSAATCDPNAFTKREFTLRQAQYNPPRRTELFIVITMYNEDDELFIRTMHGVMKNIAHLCKSQSRTWGPDGWRKVVVCIVSDGRKKIHPRALSAIAVLGAYQDGVAKNVVNGNPVVAHIYEYTTQVCLTPSRELEGSEKGIVPVQVLFCLKENNQKKINSHRWFFNAFGPILQPNICILIDVGTQPGPSSIYELWKAFDTNPNVGGACGEIVAQRKRWFSGLNPLVAAQHFEYKISNILDKPLESIFGYITVLPGAFSAYRYKAVQNDEYGNGPLQQYFIGEQLHGISGAIFKSNMHLAEDRILCWELVSKRGGSWILRYVKSAYAVTDVPDQVPELISQRRRWLNGSFFAAIHSLHHFWYIYRSNHTLLRKFWIHVEMVYQLYNFIFSFFALGNYYIAFRVLTNAMVDDSVIDFKAASVLNSVLDWLYLGLLVMCFVLSLGNRPQGSKVAYTSVFLGFSVIAICMIAAVVILTYIGIKGVLDENNGSPSFQDFLGNAIFRNIVISLTATFGLYLISSLLFCEPWLMLTSFIPYVLMAPSYIAVLTVYAFSNVHDISWGTKGDNESSSDLGSVRPKHGSNMVEVNVPTDQRDIGKKYMSALKEVGREPDRQAQKKGSKKENDEDLYKSFRTKVLLYWLLSNGLLACVVIFLTGNAKDRGVNSTVSGYMAFMLYSIVVLTLFRFIGSVTYLVTRKFA